MRHNMKEKKIYHNYTTVLCNRRKKKKFEKLESDERNHCSREVQ